MTPAIDATEEQLAAIQYNADGLVPVITQDADSGMRTTPARAPKAAEPKAVASAVVGRPSRAIG